MVSCDYYYKPVPLVLIVPIGCSLRVTSADSVMPSGLTCHLPTSLHDFHAVLDHVHKPSSVSSSTLPT